MRIRRFLLLIFFLVLPFFALTKNTFSQERNLKAYYFWTSGCSPCQKASANYSKAVGDYAIPMVKINAKSNPSLAKKYCVQGVPALILTSNGKFINIHSGLDDTKRIKRFLSRSLGMPTLSDCSQKAMVSTKSTEESTSDVSQEKNNPPSKVTEEDKQKSKLPLVAVGTVAIIAGAVLTNNLLKKKDSLVPSPADGSMVTQAQAKHEQSMLDQGYVYNPQKGGFDYQPTKIKQKTVAPSSFSKQIAKEKATRHARYKAQEKARKQAIRKADIEADMELEQKRFRRYKARADEMDTLSKGAQVVEAVADVGVDVLSKVTGPAGEIVKDAYEAAKDVNTVASEMIDKGAKKGILSGTSKLFKKKVRGKIIKGSRQIIGEGERLGGKITDSIVDKVTDEIIKKKVTG